MTILTLWETLENGPSGVWPKGCYVMEDQNAAELRLMFPDAKISIQPKLIPSERDNPKTILVYGGLGMGDAIMITPVLRALAEKHPQAKIDVGCLPHYHQALFNLPYVNALAAYPMTTDEVQNYEQVYYLENFVRHPKAKTHHMSDVFAELCGVTLTDYRADLILLETELAWAQEMFPRVKGRKRLGMQVQASHRCRTYPADLLRDVMAQMTTHGWEVYLMGAPGEYAMKEGAHLYDSRTKAPLFRDSCAFLTTCDAFVGSDSGFLHAAGALGVPAVGLFGAFPWKLRTAHYKSVHAIQGKGDCSPCFYTPTKLQPTFPRSGPCAQTGRCEVLASITPERIRAKIERVAR